MRDPIWQFAGAIVAIVAIAFAFAQEYFFSEQYSLQLVVLATTALVEIEESAAEDIEIYYKGSPANDIVLMQIKLENTGNQPIRPEDYSSPIKIIYPVDAQVVEARILETEPDNINVKLDQEKNEIQLSPELLNAGDRIILRVLVSNLSSSNSIPFEVQARIANIRTIEVLNAIDQTTTASNIAFGVINVVAGAGVALASIL
ncbi:MAG: hypothetical protein IPJ90_07325 [Anaerolineaceae bacterium]|nr:hypothetical protein [Anaerolineaceae bacterium]